MYASACARSFHAWARSCASTMARIRIGRQRLGDRRREIGDQQRLLRLLLQSRRDLGLHPIQRAAVAELGTRGEARPFLRGVSRSARATTSADSCRSRCSRRAVSANSCTRAGSGRRRARSNVTTLRSSSRGRSSSPQSPPPFRSYSVSARRRHFVSSFAAYFFFTPRRAASSGNAEAFEETGGGGSPGIAARGTPAPRARRAGSAGFPEC